MPLRVSAMAVVLLTAPALLCQSPVTPASADAPAIASTASPKPLSSATPESGSPSHVLFFYTAPRSEVEMEVHNVPANDQARFDRLREDFRSAGCDDGHMREQRVDKKPDAGSSLVCSWPGDTPDTIVIAAHYEHPGKGQGALEDWSGAALLPFLYQAIQGQTRHNTFVFLESWKADGAEAWLRALPRPQRKHVLAMIDVDGLGMGVTRYYTTFAAFEEPVLGASHLQTELLWAALDDGLKEAPQMTSPHHWLSIDSTGSFRSLMVPTIVIHSVPLGSRLPGSEQDVASAVDGNAYFQSYELMCTYLASLDRVAARLNTDDPHWRLTPGVDARPADENPRVTFRAIGGVMRK